MSLDISTPAIPLEEDSESRVQKPRCLAMRGLKSFDVDWNEIYLSRACPPFLLLLPSSLLVWLQIPKEIRGILVCQVTSIE
jgi:hypothetical protein